MSKVENNFEIGEKVAWTYMGKDVPGVVKDKNEGDIVANSGGKEIKRKGDENNPAYVLAMDKGDSKDGKEVAKKGSNLHSREDKGNEGDAAEGTGAAAGKGDDKAEAAAADDDAQGEKEEDDKHEEDPSEQNKGEQASQDDDQPIGKRKATRSSEAKSGKAAKAS